MPERPEPEVSESEIAVHWREEPRIDPPASLARESRNRALLETLADSRFPARFRALAELLEWDHPFETVLDESHPPFYRWYAGGRLNASVNAIDRHLPRARDRVAYYFVPEDEHGTIVPLTYGELATRVHTLAYLLQERFGCRRGDRVTIHLPMVPELPIAMLACARLGLIHTVVFSGFSAQALTSRIVDSESRLLITMDGYFRNGQWLDHKVKADEACLAASAQGVRVESVLVFERDPGHYRSKSPITPGRDVAMTALLAETGEQTVAPVSLESNEGLFIMYSSGTTGRPKGCLHGIGGYLAWVTATSRLVLDLQPEDVYWCMADIGWITGHSYIVYGPLSIGATSVLYEGVPNFPDAGRPWRLAEALGVRILHTSPTAIRALRREGPDAPRRYHPPFRVLATVGEPIEPETWHWYHEVVGRGEAAVVDTYWQTETGGHLLSTLPAVQAMKPGSAGPTLPGIEAAIYDETGHQIPPGSQRAGILAIERPWPGLMLGIWKDPARFQATYFEPLKHGPLQDRWVYCTHDAATQSADGYFRILGRTDDVINVSGHRLGSKEIESAALTVASIAEAAVIPYPDPVKAHVPLVFVSTRPGIRATETVAQAVEEAIVSAIGPIARPRAVVAVEDLPKTRSGKIMRRVLRAIAQGGDPGDVTTLANPESVKAIQKILEKMHMQPDGPSGRSSTHPGPRP